MLYKLGLLEILFSIIMLKVLIFTGLMGKKDFGYSFPYDGPGRGGTCDIVVFLLYYTKKYK